MKKTCAIAFAAMLLFADYGSALASKAEQFGDYDFSYEVAGEFRAKPLQVFDNGVATYFQFRSGEPIPLILATSPTGSIRIKPEMEGPYVRVKGVFKEYVLKMGKATVKVTYAGSRSFAPAATAQAPEVASAAYAQVVLPGDDVPRPQYRQTGHPGVVQRNVQDEVLPRIAVDVNSYAIPVRGDVAQFQPQGVEPIVAINPAQVTAAKSVGRETFLSGSPVAVGSPSATGVKGTDIPFVNGVSNPGPYATKLLRKVASDFRPGHTVTVVGQYDTTFKENQASERARAIASVLKREGVPGAMIRVSTQEALGSQTGKFVVGAKVVLHTGNGTSNALQQQGYVSAQQVTDATLSSLEQQLRSKRITPSQASKQVSELRAQTQARHVQPLAGWQEAQITTWQMRATDFTVQGVLQRWAAEAGWQVVWKNGPEIKVLSDSDTLIRDGFLAASDYVLAQARSMGYAIKGRAYNNRVLVISAN